MKRTMLVVVELDVKYSVGEMTIKIIKEVIQKLLLCGKCNSFCCDYFFLGARNFQTNNI